MKKELSVLAISGSLRKQSSNTALMNAMIGLASSRMSSFGQICPRCCRRWSGLADEYGSLMIRAKNQDIAILRCPGFFMMEREWLQGPASRSACSTNLLSSTCDVSSFFLIAPTE